MHSRTVSEAGNHPVKEAVYQLVQTLFFSYEMHTAGGNEGRLSLTLEKNKLRKESKYVKYRPNNLKDWRLRNFPRIIAEL